MNRISKIREMGRWVEEYFLGRLQLNQYRYFYIELYSVQLFLIDLS